MKSQIKIGQLLLCVTILGLATGLRGFAAENGERIVDPARIVGSLQPPSADTNGEKIFAGLVEHSHLRDQLLKQYSVVRMYQVGNTEGKTYGQEVVEVEYHAPDQKTFTKKSEQGSWLVRHLVLDRLVDSEEQASSGRDHRDSSIVPRNYSFKLLGEDQIGPYECYVVKVTPRRADKYLFQGWMWISKEDFGIVRIAGSPAKGISFWVERVDFVREYRKIGIFWLPAKDETTAKIRWKGTKVLTIVHANYSVNGFQINRAETQAVPGMQSEIAPQIETPAPAGPRATFQEMAKKNAIGSGENR
jgi:hypothetical protein